MNIFMNFVKKSSAKEETKGGIRALGEIRDLLLLVSDLAPTSSSCFPGMLAGRLTRELHQVVQNPRVILQKMEV